MTDTASPKSHKELMTQIVTGVVGAVILGLQGVNISETNSNAELIKHVERALHQQTELIQHINDETARVEEAIKNQQEMIELLRKNSQSHP